MKELSLPTKDRKIEQIENSSISEKYFSKKIQFTIILTNFLN